MTQKTKQTVLEALEFSKQSFERIIDVPKADEKQVVLEILADIEKAKTEILNIE